MTLGDYIAAILSDAPKDALRQLAGPVDANRTDAAIGLARRLTAAVYKYFKREGRVKIRNRDLVIRFERLEDKIFVAIRTAPLECLSALGSADAARAKQAQFDLTGIIEPVVLEWMENLAGPNGKA
ncbi:hypothetical protein KUV46_15590 [Thalassovita mediterranea]|nr:hypothetical protein KUV46_15590 [Thalassovita mediterranea]